jgi:hypothetical protein
VLVFVIKQNLAPVTALIVLLTNSKIPIVYADQALVIVM